MRQNVAHSSRAKMSSLRGFRSNCCANLRHLVRGDLNLYAGHFHGKGPRKAGGLYKIWGFLLLTVGVFCLQSSFLLTVP